MRRYSKLLLFVLIILLIVGVALLAKVNFIPPEIRQYASDWPTANQNLSNTRAAVGSTIEISNVGKLAPAWSFPIAGVSEWGAAATNPLILGNVVYFQDLQSNIYAVDFTDGKKIWAKEYSLPVAGPSGVAIGYGKIFSQKGRYDIVALDLNGKEIWDKKISNNQDVGVDIQPAVYGNMVFVSTVPGISNENFYKGGAFGVIYALDVNSGAIKWSFNTVGTDDLWGNSKVNSGGGAWYPPAVDVVTNNTFWGIGNAAPWPGTKEFPNGTSRPGANLYTSSMVALNSTGKLVWYNQVAPHDLFDYDFQISPILATLPINDVNRDVVIGAGKMGKVVVFDRKTGQTIWTTAVGDHLNDTLKELPSGVTQVAPSPLGGIETNMAYADGIVYASVNNMVVSYTSTGFVASSFNLASGKGELVALDGSTGKVLWDNRLDSLNVGAATVVNDLVFTATFNGKIYAYNRKTGELVWQYQAPGGINGWPAVKGDTIIFPIGLGKNPQLLAFKIGGSLTKGVSPTLPSAGSGKGFQQ